MAYKPWLLTSPASRGIGLQLARRLLITTDLPVVATARKNVDETKAKILAGLHNIDSERLSVFPIDVTDESTISAAASQIKEVFPLDTHYLHLAYLVPGILPNPEKSPAQISASASLDTFRVNTLGPLLLIKHLHEFLPRKSTPLPSSISPSLPPQAVTAVMSARVGSISDNALGGWYSYRASKAAVNQIVKTFDIHLKQRSGEKAIAVGLHPGTVKTGLSKEFWKNVKESKLFSGEFAAERLGEVIKEVGVGGRGRCWDWEGKEVVP
ncbi:MAG: hypothetical protein LQ348_004258 [Seirophora lacunosa]|nr:MAG: hypothetical protein LQ344_003505 [Seirophora lacunosa]KAI4186167.1 MAG: hypothetical protein LQ348_004258 [Seirophora lacunosa]